MASDQGWGGTRVRRFQERYRGTSAYKQGARVAGFGRDVWGNLGKTGIGRAVQRGAAMEFGFLTPEYLSGGRAGPMPKNPSGFSFLGGGSLRGVTGARSFGGAAKAVGKLGLKALPMIGGAAFIYSGYKEGGIAGAVDAGIENMKMGIAWEVGSAALGSGALPIAAAAAVVGAGAYGYYQFGEAAQRYGRKTRRLEMGGEIIDRFGTISTMRQRSLQALNNTHMNGRMALGNEAMLTHRPMY